MEILKRARITLLSEVNIQSNLLKESLESKLSIVIDIVPFKRLNQIAGTDRSSSDIIVFDYGNMSDSDFQMYADAKAKQNAQWKEILINCPSDIQSPQLFKWHNLVGVFYIDDTVSCLAKGISKILENEMWLSRKIAQDYIQHFRSNKNTTTSQTYATLTKREKQIIQSLASGASNIQIAEELFVSENTIKTHLHNIFKKINAKNRLQALLWANNNIGAEEKV